VEAHTQIRERQYAQKERRQWLEMAGMFSLTDVGLKKPIAGIFF
jgi:hypothetical protein